MQLSGYQWYRNLINKNKTIIFKAVIESVLLFGGTKSTSGGVTVSKLD